MSDLRAYRWHTGAELSPVDPSEALGPLFRDVGVEGLTNFLSGSLRRLAGPMTPLTYMRTAEWREPYTDHARTGRLAILRPHALRPWRAGVPHVFVARASAMPEEEALGYVPGDVTLAEAASSLDGASHRGELREALGGSLHDEQCESDRAMLVALARERDAVDRVLESERRMLQSGSHLEAGRVRARLAHFDLREDDLCAAWHHLPEDRRARLRAWSASEGP